LFPPESEFSDTRRTREPGTLDDPPTLRSARLARRIAEERLAEAAGILKDERLSKAGKEERLRATHAAAVERLAVPQKYLAGIQEELKAEREKLAPKGLDPGDAVGAAAGQEYRGYLRALDGAQRLNAVQRVILEEDQATLTKIVGGPPELSGITATTWNQARAALIQLQHPDRAARVELLEANADALHRAVWSAASIVDEIGGQPFDRATMIEA
jgi:hypothetical protein